MSDVSGFVGAYITKRIRNAVVLNFRLAFSTDTSYPYIQNLDGTVNFDCSGIVINDSTPDDSMSLPAINVMTLSGEEHRFIQEDFFEQFVDTNGAQVTRRGAPLSVSVAVDATALDTITRDEVLDRMYEKFKIITDDLANNGVGILKTSMRPDRREYRGDRWWYTSGVELSLYAEWIEEETIDPNSKLRSVKVGIYTPGGIFQPFQL